MCGFVILGQCTRVRVECSVVPAFLRLPAKGVLAPPLSHVLTTFSLFLLSSRTVCRDAHASSTVSFFNSIAFAFVVILLHYPTHSVLLCLFLIMLLLYFMVYVLHFVRSDTPLFVVCVVNVFVEKHYFATIQQKLLLQRCPGRSPFFCEGESLDGVVCTLLLPDIPTLQQTYPSPAPSRMQNRMHNCASSFSLFDVFF